MKLLLSNNNLTRYSSDNDYATVTDIPLEGEIASIAQTLLAWLGQQLKEDESISQVLLEPNGQAVIGYEIQLDVEGNEMEVPSEYRPRLNAAITVDHPVGSRTFALSSEELPAELRDGLLASWDLVAAIPVNIEAEGNVEDQIEPDPQPPQSDPEV